jgi:hypothetical protein
VNRKSNENIADKVARYLRAHDAGKRNYAKADRLLAELAKEAGVDIEIPLNDSGKKAIIKDRFKDKNLVFQPCAARRYELKIKP